MTRETASPWRRRLRLEISLALLLKLIMLIALWALFFSAAHRIKPDAAALSHRFATGAHSRD